MYFKFIHIPLHFSPLWAYDWHIVAKIGCFCWFLCSIIFWLRKILPDSAVKYPFSLLMWSITHLSSYHIRRLGRSTQNVNFILPHPFCWLFETLKSKLHHLKVNTAVKWISWTINDRTEFLIETFYSHK